MRDLIGHTLGHYRIVEQIGAGGMGVVYRARDERLDRDVAVKVLPEGVASDPDRLRRFEREAKAVAALSHPNILEIFDFDIEGGVAHAVTELLEGETLREHLQTSDGPMPWERVQETGLAVADGLGAAHAKSVIHRDIKPSNIFLCSDGRVKILDFGLAATHEVMDGEAETASIEAPLTREGSVMGTVGYMAPEQVRGRPTDHRSDIFALGCVLYEMLTDCRAFPGDTDADVLSAILTKAPPSMTGEMPGVPDALSRIVERCLEKSPEQRFQSAQDLAFALRSLSAPAPAARAETARASDERPSVAVLPFVNLSADPEQEFFCDGMAEEIINALAQVERLRVVARTSAFAFKGKHEDMREIGRKLNVDAIVEGSVRKAGDRLRITAQLIDVRDGSHLWSERFDRRLEDVFEIQDQIALTIVDKLEVKLLGKERAAVIKRPTDNLDAYEAYLKGWYHWNELTPEGYVRSRQCFEEAMEIDPDFAGACAGLAAWYISQSFWAEISPEDALAAAMPLLERALLLDDRSPLAHTMIGIARGCFERDWASAERSFVKAVEHGPNAVEAHAHYGLMLLLRGRFEEALAEVRMAKELDPLSPTWNAWACSWQAMAGEHEEGISGLENVVAIHPHHWLPHYHLGFLYIVASRLEEARAENEQAVELSGGVSATISQLACCHYLLGEKGHGDELFELLRQRARASYVPPTFLAWVHLTRGKVGDALEQLREAVRGKDPWLPFYRLIAPAFDPGGDPRIDVLLEEQGL